jgi:hypothetical protein
MARGASTPLAPSSMGFADGGGGARDARDERLPGPRGFVTVRAMLRVVESEEVGAEADALAAKLKSQQRIALGTSVDTSGLIAALAGRVERPAVTRIAPGLDVVPRTVLELARGGDPERISAIDEALATPDGLGATLKLLGDSLTGRTVVVEHLHRLTSVEGDEVAGALARERGVFTEWLLKRADLVTEAFPLTRCGLQGRPSGLTGPTVALCNGTRRNAKTPWVPGTDPDAYALALQIEALQDGEEVETALLGDRDALRQRLWSLLPESLQTLLRSLAVFGRPLPTDRLDALPGYQTECFSRGGDLSLWHNRADEVVLDPSWTEWCDRRLPRAERDECRRAMAESFARSVRPDDLSARRAGLAMLDAVRLFVELGEVERAVPYARHGVALLVGYARDLSRERRYLDAARIYERLDTASLPGLRGALRGYVKHYLHFNRAHARPELEPVLETARGYDAALNDWPENAIFWSRTVRAWFLAGDPAHARSQLNAAYALGNVPPHRDRDARLRARTARRLAQLGFPIEAMDVLGDYTPDTLRARDDVAQCEASLAAGWDTDLLKVPGATQPVLAFHRRVRVRVERLGGTWRFFADQLGHSARCATPLDAARDFVRTLGEEVRGLLKRFDRDLDGDERARKALLLSTVDLIVSGLDAQGGPTTWVYGRLLRVDDSHWLVEGGNREARYRLAPELAEATVGDDPYLAKVDAGPSGVPKGPVRELEPLAVADRDEVLRRWREKLAG